MIEVKDSNGNELSIGDSICTVKDIKVKGMSKGIKQGTKFEVKDLIMDEESIEVKLGKSVIGLKPSLVKKLN